MRRILSIIAGAAVLSCAVQSGTSSAAPASGKDELARGMHTFNSIVKELQSGYVDTLPGKTLMRNTILALLDQIDPYTEYYPSDEQDELLSISSGQYAGIGSYIIKRGNDVIIHQPQWNSPARNAGLRPGDVILRVNGDTVTPSMAVGDVSKKLRGQAGTNVSIDIRRPYVEDSLLTVDIVRGNIKVDPVPYFGMLPSGVGYIRLTTFNENSAREVREAVLDLMAKPGLKGIVLDLRDNGGGLLESAVQIVSNFVPKGTEVVKTRGRNEKNVKTYKTTSKPLDQDIPLAILVNGGTASAAEIVSGALQDLDRAVIVGERSYGKGLVQNTRPLPYNDILKITTARYYIPSGPLIQAIDYSRRNPDGSVARTPDSLTNEFRTSRGRIVRDGGGITPDIVYKEKDGNRLLYNIIADFWAFDFANRFAATHTDIAPADSFEISEEMFADFKASIDPDKFKYDRQCETGLEYLREAAKAEGYMNDSVAAQFDILAGMLKHDLNRDLDFNRKDIIKILDTEITSRYYSDADMTRRATRDDSTLTVAEEVILDSSRYKSLLSPEK